MLHILLFISCCSFSIHPEWLSCLRVFSSLSPESMLPLLPSSVQSKVNMLVPGRKFDLSYDLNFSTLCSDFQENIEFQFSLGWTALVHRYLGSVNAQRALRLMDNKLQVWRLSGQIDYRRDSLYRLPHFFHFYSGVSTSPAPSVYTFFWTSVHLSVQQRHCSHDPGGPDGDDGQQRGCSDVPHLDDRHHRWRSRTFSPQALNSSLKNSFTNSTVNSTSTVLCLKVWRTIGWRLIALSASMYGLLYLYERLTWTTKAKERTLKRQFVDYASEKLQLIVSFTGSNCSHQVQQ